MLDRAIPRCQISLLDSILRNKCSVALRSQGRPKARFASTRKAGNNNNNGAHRHSRLGHSRIIAIAKSLHLQLLGILDSIEVSYMAPH
jgi:hypothetical protein